MTLVAVVARGSTRAPPHVRRRLRHSQQRHGRQQGQRGPHHASHAPGAALSSALRVPSTAGAHPEQAEHQGVEQIGTLRPPAERDGSLCLSDCAPTAHPVRGRQARRRGGGDTAAGRRGRHRGARRRTGRERLHRLWGAAVRAWAPGGRPADGWCCMVWHMPWRVGLGSWRCRGGSRAAERGGELSSFRSTRRALLGRAWG